MIYTYEEKIARIEARIDKDYSRIERIKDKLTSTIAKMEDKKEAYLLATGARIKRIENKITLDSINMGQIHRHYADPIESANRTFIESMVRYDPGTEELTYQQRPDISDFSSSKAHYNWGIQKAGRVVPIDSDNKVNLDGELYDVDKLIQFLSQDIFM